jgi:hypothetical protein
VVRLIHVLVTGTITSWAAGGIADAVADDPIRREVAGTRSVPLTILLLLVALILAALRARGRARRAVAVLLLPVSGAWITFNGRFEGPILITFSSSHGMTVSDLLAVLGVLVAAGVLVLDRRRRRRPGPPRPTQAVDSGEH